MEKVKAWYKTVQNNPDEKAKRRTIPLILEGTWDGEKFVSHDEKGLETIVRKKAWIIFTCDHCDKMGTEHDHPCPYDQDLHSHDGDICNCCDVCTQDCANDL